LIEGKDSIEGGNDLVDGVPVFRRKGLDQDLAKRPDLFLRLVADAEAIKRQWAPDVVHCHACGVSGWINLLTGKTYPNVVTLHSSTLRLPRGIQERMLVEAACVTAVSKSMKGGFAEQAANRKTPVRVIYNGMKAPVLAPAPLGLARPVALCYGRLADEKGFDLALHAFAKLPQLRIIIAGDGAARAGLERLAGRLDLGSRIEFRGFVNPDSIPALINEASFVVVPSRFEEGLPLVAIESGLIGRPIVGSNVGGLPEIVMHGQTGLLVPAENPDALAAAIRALLDDPARTEGMGMRARERALTQFSIERCADEFDDVYHSVGRARP
jgi:glycogen(starch) synthase